MPTQFAPRNFDTQPAIQTFPRQESLSQGLADWQIEALKNLTHQEPLLVTDDDWMSRKYYRALLADTMGLGLVETSDPSEALRICQSQAISLVITCLIKPARMDGITLITDLRSGSKTCAIPLLIITAALHTRELAYEAGADAYLNKPCHPNEILQEVWRLLRGRIL